MSTDRHGTRGMINNNINNINQQYIAPKTTHWALKETQTKLKSSFAWGEKSKLSKLTNRKPMKINKLNQKLSVPIERYTLI